MELYTETVDECLGIYGEGVGELDVVQRRRGRRRQRREVPQRRQLQAPGEYNSHSKQSGKERQATGSIDLGDAGTREFGSAVLATISWTDHSNN